jgi:hypothetical protein
MRETFANISLQPTITLRYGRALLVGSLISSRTASSKKIIAAVSGCSNLGCVRHRCRCHLATVVK